MSGSESSLPERLVSNGWRSLAWHTGRRNQTVASELNIAVGRRIGSAQNLAPKRDFNVVRPAQICAPAHAFDLVS
jgi:hypothetical protein